MRPAADGAPGEPSPSLSQLLTLVLAAPQTCGGIVVAGGSPEFVAGLCRATDATVLPLSADSGRLLGGVDLVGTLAGGRAVRSGGLLGARAGPLVVPLASRLPEAIVAILVRLLDGTLTDAHGAPVPSRAVIAFEDGRDGIVDARLCDRLAFRMPAEAISADRPTLPSSFAAMPCGPEAIEAVVTAAHALGIVSLRPPVQALAAARAFAAFDGASEVGEAHVRQAVDAALLWRATQVPAPPADDPPPPPPNDDAPDGEEGDSEGEPDTMADRVLDAVATTVDPAVLALSMARQNARRKAAAGRAGAKTKTLRGRPVGVRSGIPPRDGTLALVETLTAALPWRAVREGPQGRIPVRRADLRVRRSKARSRTLTLFCVDASGSQAYAKMAEAKGAVETLLARSYVRRDEVALIAFRREGADLLLPPTNSLTRAKRQLAALPAGGGTPLASGLAASLSVGERASADGCEVTLVLLTDAKANVALDGSGGRERAQADALSLARRIAGSPMTAVLVDTGKRPGPAAKALASAMGASYTPLGRDAARQLAGLGEATSLR